MQAKELYNLFKQYPLICTDTRKVQKGSLFFALRGENFNGNKFAQKAIEMGCVYAIIDEEKYQRNEPIFSGTESNRRELEKSKRATLFHYIGNSDRFNSLVEHRHCE